MATKKSTTASKAAESVHDHRELESKIASLESKIASLEKSLATHEAKSEKEHAALAQKCEACCSAKSGGDDSKLKSELKKYFSSLNNRKVPTHIPDLD